MDKMKERLVTSSNTQCELAAALSTTIHGTVVEVVEEYRSLGTIFDHQLRFTAYVEKILSKTRLQSTVKLCSKIIGLPVRSLSSLYEQQALRVAGRILQDPSHALHSAFKWPLSLQDREEKNYFHLEKCCLV